MSIERSNDTVRRAVSQVWGERWEGRLLPAVPGDALTGEGSTLGRWSKDNTFEVRISWHQGDIWSPGCPRHWAILEFAHPPSDPALEREVYKALREVLVASGEK